MSLTVWDKRLGCWGHFLERPSLTFCKQLQDRVYLVAQEHGLARGQLRFSGGERSKNGVKGLGKREKQESGVCQRQMKKLNGKKKNRK